MTVLDLAEHMERVRGLLCGPDSILQRMIEFIAYLRLSPEEKVLLARRAEEALR